MAGKLDLSWHTPRKCWRKRRKGKTYYLATGGVCKGKSDREGLRIAKEEWKQKLAELEAEEGPEPKSTKGFIAHLEQMVEANPNINVKAIFNAGLQQTASRAEFKSAGTSKPTTSNDLSGAVQRYLNEKRADYNAGLRSSASYREYHAKLDTFLGGAIAAGKTDINDIDAEFLSEYRNAQLAQVGNHEDSCASLTTVGKRLFCAKAFLEWAYELELLKKLPRNIRRFAQVPKQQPTPMFYTPEEVRELYAAANPAMRTYIALAANCSFTQVDISSLTWEMIDEDTRILSRKRQKTERVATKDSDSLGVDSEFRLWPVTMRLLKQVSKTKTGWVFCTAKGSPILRTGLNNNGGGTGSDTVADRFLRLRNKFGDKYKDKPFKVFRKTSADLVAKKYQKYPHVRDMFLAHSIPSMSVHYVRQYFDLVHEACDYLDTVFKLGDIS